MAPARVPDDLARLIGPWPERAALDAEVIDVEDLGSYERETVRYAVSASERITAFVNVPKDIDAPVPAVFCHHQHASTFHLGKSEVVGLAGDPDQAYAHELAARRVSTDHTRVDVDEVVADAPDVVTADFLVERGISLSCTATTSRTTWSRRCTATSPQPASYASFAASLASPRPRSSGEFGNTTCDRSAVAGPDRALSTRTSSPVVENPELAPSQG